MLTIDVHRGGASARPRAYRCRISFSATVAAVAALAVGGCDRETATPPATLTVMPQSVPAGATAELSWHAAPDAACTAAGSWNGTRAADGRTSTPPLTDAVNVFSLTCVTPTGTERTSAVVTVPGGRESGLDFPGSAATTGTVRFRFTRPLAIYPATYIWRVWLRSQPEYYTAFFWGNDGEFRWDDGKSNSYYGAHPYPFPAPNFVSPEQVGPRYWEISVGGLDVLSKPQVEYGRWHVQALRVWAGVFGKHHEFYWDLPDTTKVIAHREPRAYGNEMPPRPALTWGDAPWAPSKEIMNGVIRGIQIYSSALSIEEILGEVDRPLSTSAGDRNIWYLNLDPTPDNIADESGLGHDPEWVGSERPTLWIGP